MTIATEKKKIASNKFLLCRIEPARYIGPSLVSQGGGLYSMTFNYPVAKIQRNGEDLTSVSATPTSNDEYYYNETTNTLEIKLAAAPDADDNVIVAYYYLFYTDQVGRYIQEDPTGTGSVREWKPRLTSLPSIKQTVRNILAGTLSLSSSQVSIINVDNDLQQYLTINDSFKNKKITLWLCIGDVTNIQKVFEGRIKNVKLSATNAVFTLLDPFVKAREIALMGDPREEAYFLDETGSYPNMYPPDSGTPISYVVGKSNQQFVDGDGITGTLGTGIQATVYSLDPAGMKQAVCTNYSAAVSSSLNREWHVARTSANGFKVIDFGTISSVVYSSTINYFIVDNYGTGTIYPRIDVTSTGHNLEIGDIFNATTNGILHRCFVINRTDTTYRCMITGNGPHSTIETTNWNSSTFTSHISCRLVIEYNNKKFYPVYDRDYTVTESTTTGGNKLLKITFVAGFEINMSDPGFPFSYNMNTLHPTTHKVYYAVTEKSPGTSHADIVKKLVQDSGLTVNTASFTQADTDLSANCVFTVPNFGEREYNTRLKYLEDVLASSLGYTYLNSDFEVEYKVFKALTSGNVKDNNIIARDSFSINIDYEDIASEIRFANPYDISPNPGLVADSTVTVISNKSKYLNDAEIIKEINHVLEDMTTRGQDILDILNTRKAIYTFKTINDDIDSDIGDNVTIDTERLLDKSNVVLVGLSKKLNETTITAFDLGDL